MSLIETIRHAFDLGNKEPFSPNDNQKIIVEKVCREIIKRNLALPAIVTLETLRPLNYLGSQIMHFFHPIISSVLTIDGYTEFSSLLEKRESVDYLINKIRSIENNCEDLINK